MQRNTYLTFISLSFFLASSATNSWGMNGSPDDLKRRLLDSAPSSPERKFGDGAAAGAGAGTAAGGGGWVAQTLVFNDEEFKSILDNLDDVTTDDLFKKGRGGGVSTTIGLAIKTINNLLGPKKPTSKEKEEAKKAAKFLTLLYSCIFELRGSPYRNGKAPNTLTLPEKKAIVLWGGSKRKDTKPLPGNIYDIIMALEKLSFLGNETGIASLLDHPIFFEALSSESFLKRQNVIGKKFDDFRISLNAKLPTRFIDQSLGIGRPGEINVNELEDALPAKTFDNIYKNITSILGRNETAFWRGYRIYADEMFTKEKMSAFVHIQDSHNGDTQTGISTISTALQAAKIIADAFEHTPRDMKKSEKEKTTKIAKEKTMEILSGRSGFGLRKTMAEPEEFQVIMDTLKKTVKGVKDSDIPTMINSSFASRSPVLKTTDHEKNLLICALFSTERINRMNYDEKITAVAKKSRLEDVTARLESMERCFRWNFRTMRPQDDIFSERK
jgi:hypothetical protein